MALTKAQRRALVADIRAAFADVPVPAVVVAEDCWERDSEAVFVGRCWRELEDVTLLRRHEDMLYWFSAEAFRHYLPAFLLAAIQHRREADVIPLTLVSVLTRDEGNAALFKERVRLLTEGQKKVIARYLAYEAETAGEGMRRDPNRALNRYWRRWLA